MGGPLISEPQNADLIENTENIIKSSDSPEKYLDFFLKRHESLKYVIFSSVIPVAWGL